MNTKLETEYEITRQEMINVQNKMHKIKNGPMRWSKEREDEYERLRDLYNQLYQRLSSY